MRYIDYYRFIRTSVLLTFSLPALSRASDNDSPEILPRINRQIVEAITYDYKYQRPETAEAKPEEKVDQFCVEADTNTVVLKRVIVYADSGVEKMSRAIKAYRAPQGPQNNSFSGTGIHETDFGKVRVSVVTVLGVPVFGEAAW